MNDIIALIKSLEAEKEVIGQQLMENVPFFLIEMVYLMWIMVMYHK